MFQGRAPLAIDPLAMQPELRAAKLKLLPGAPEEDGVSGGIITENHHGGYYALPPTVVVKGIDLFVEAEGPVRLSGGNRANQNDVDELAEALGGFVVGSEGVELEIEVIIIVLLGMWA